LTQWSHPLGTDSLGRDIAAMIAHGARATLLIGLVAATTATLLGVGIGAASAWAGGWVDEVLMRVTELFQIIPNVVFVLTVVSILGPHIEAITLAIGLVSWPPIARLTRAEFCPSRSGSSSRPAVRSGCTRHTSSSRKSCPMRCPR
jgi:peptide/nickel transport system permease protein